MAQKRKRIGQILKSMGLVTDDQINGALIEQRLGSTKKIAEILIERKIVTPLQVAQALLKQWEERVLTCEDNGIVIKSIQSLLGQSENIFELQHALVDIMHELENLKEDLDALYQVTSAIVTNKNLKH